MFSIRRAGATIALSFLVSCSPTYQVGDERLTAAEYERYKSEEHTFSENCDIFRQKFRHTIIRAIDGKISSDELAQAYDGRPSHPDFECRIKNRAIVGPQPRDEDYIALLESRARNSFERQKAAEKCGRPEDGLMQHLSCVSNYVTYWRETGQSLDVQAKYIIDYGTQKLSEMPFEQFKGVEYYFAMWEAEKRLAQFEFFYRIKGRAANSVADQLDSLDSRLYSIERKLPPY
jgi:hypothetical protein